MKTMNTDPAILLVFDQQKWAGVEDGFLNRSRGAVWAPKMPDCESYMVGYRHGFSGVAQASDCKHGPDDAPLICTRCGWHIPEEWNYGYSTD